MLTGAESQSVCLVFGPPTPGQPAKHLCFDKGAKNHSKSIAIAMHTHLAIFAINSKRVMKMRISLSR